MTPEQQNSDKEAMQPENSEEQNVVRGNIPKGFVFTNNESLKQFYLRLTPMMCPSITQEASENEVLHILYTRIRRTCKLLALLDNYPWTGANPLLIKACGIFHIMDTTTSTKDKRQLNEFLYTRTKFIDKIIELHDLIAHDLIFFSKIRNNLEAILHIEVPTQENSNKG